MQPEGQDPGTPGARRLRSAMIAALNCRRTFKAKPPERSSIS
jgi:hypothetical protein